MRSTMLVAVAISLAGCNSRGVARLDDQLIWAANQMNVLNENQRTVSYVHDNPARYWVFAAPAGTTADRLTGLLPELTVKILADCFKSGHSTLAVIEQSTWDCIQSPNSFPRIAEFMLVAKGPGESTDLVIERRGEGLDLASMK